MQDTTRRLGIWAVVVLLLLMVPLVGMQFSDEVNWDLFDFILMGSALFSVGVAFEFVARRSHTTMYRIALGVGLVGAFLLFWVNGAVGIIGNEGQPANLLYWGVFAVGVVGALLSRFQSRGMARTMFAVAGIQFFVPVVALMIWPDVSWGGAGIVGVYMMNSFFAMIFMTSGGLFLRAHKVLPPLRPTT